MVDCTREDKHPHGHCPVHCGECGGPAKGTICGICAEVLSKSFCIRCQQGKVIPGTTMCEDCWKAR